ncbi:PA0050 family protein [Burkholderia stagnalis]|uniref:PA0050 family protein n=1 Tax=Burkholderia stagnalis TaxID=1503054 RepID=UPI0039BFE59D
MRGVTRRPHQRSTNSRIRLIPIILRADIPDENQNPAGFPDASSSLSAMAQCAVIGPSKNPCGLVAVIGPTKCVCTLPGK